jgi:DNA-binding transcriptional LysR family regulator
MMRYIKDIAAVVELRHLRYFTVVAEELHFSRAAQRLGIAQPPLSQQIKSLEELIGHALFERKPKVRLTPAGEALLEVSRRVFAQMEEGLSAARRIGRGEEGKLTVGFAASLLTTTLPDVLRAYREQFPNVELHLRELSTAAQAEALADGTIDVGFVREAVGGHADLSCEAVGQEEFVAVLPDKHPYTMHQHLPLRTLKGEAFVHFPRTVAPSLYDQIMRMCQRAGFQPRVVQEAREWLTIVGLVEAGLGVSLVPASFRRLKWGNVQYKPLSPPRELTTIYTCWRPASTPPTATAFIEIARQFALSQKIVARKKSV